jgi:hypothetical protein
MAVLSKLTPVTQQVTVPPRDPRISALLPFDCCLCGNRLGLLVESHGCSVICGGCSVEWRTPREIGELLHKWPALANWLIEALPGPEKYNRGREDNLVHGKAFGAKGKFRSEIFRYAIDTANGWEWNAKRPNGSAERDRLYAMKAAVGVFETKPMKSALEMCSRKIERINRARHVKIPEPLVDEIGKLIRKGVRAAEARRPTTSAERKVIVETVLARMGWPP